MTNITDEMVRVAAQAFADRARTQGHSGAPALKEALSAAYPLIRNAVLEEAAIASDQCDYPWAAPEIHISDAADDMATRISETIRDLKEGK